MKDLTDVNLKDSSHNGALVETATTGVKSDLGFEVIVYLYNSLTKAKAVIKKRRYVRTISSTTSSLLLPTTTEKLPQIKSKIKIEIVDTRIGKVLDTQEVSFNYIDGDNITDEIALTVPSNWQDYREPALAAWGTPAEIAQELAKLPSGFRQISARFTFLDSDRNLVVRRFSQGQINTVTAEDKDKYLIASIPIPKVIPTYRWRVGQRRHQLSGVFSWVVAIKADAFSEKHWIVGNSHDTIRSDRLIAPGWSWPESKSYTFTFGDRYENIASFLLGTLSTTNPDLHPETLQLKPSIDFPSGNLVHDPSALSTPGYRSLTLTGVFDQNPYYIKTYRSGTVILKMLIQGQQPDNNNIEDLFLSPGETTGLYGLEGLGCILYSQGWYKDGEDDALFASEPVTTDPYPYFSSRISEVASMVQEVMVNANVGSDTQVSLVFGGSEF